MYSTPTLQPMPRIDLVYNKTAAGRHEVAHRGAGLNARQRTALIMLDGQRDARVLETLMPAEQAAEILSMLMTRNLIAVALDTGPVPPAQPAAVSVAAPAPVALPPGSALLTTLKGELIVAAETYLGVMAAEVVGRVRAAGDEDQLLRVLGHWNMAMQASKHGRDAARTLLERTKASLYAASQA